MILCISPAKNLDFESRRPPVKATQPAMLDAAEPLIERLKRMSAAEIRKLMGVSDSLARLNARRYAEWKPPFSPENARPCIFAFAGDVYRGLDAASLSGEDLDYAQERLRILSGLYGLLRPLDLIQPYRLEMGTKLAANGSSDLYGYWGDRIAGALNEAMRAARSHVLVNLASEEYFKAVGADRIDGDVIQPVFRDLKDGKYSVFFVYAKRARGMMCRYAIERRATDPEQLKGFDLGGYRYAPRFSSEREWVFTRDTPA
jgi:cytoplasmic iron level regulating protein YaaA (DUF328/UPF0246 family)